ncbi:MAG: hypothetical protein CSB48_01295 [Proteobacteria bacterium]|nr:MAG: hypothetical protein CSB48_01295 [Pseudomonadota bacterium]
MRKQFLTLYAFPLVAALLWSEGAYAEHHSVKNGHRDPPHVIVNPSVHTDSLTLGDLRAIFSLRARQWPGGAKITVVSLNDANPVHRTFLVNTLKMLPHQLRRQWDRYIYAGIGLGPVVVNTQEEMLKVVSSTPDAIGYVEGGLPYEQVIALKIR